jgi:hypothetical protein
MQTNITPADNSAIISEYNNIRAEILNLNEQFLKILIGSVGINLTILGWLFSNKDQGENIFSLLTICVFILFFSCMLLVNRDRLAHRLAIFQELFIEKRIPAISWGRVYPQYKDAFGNNWKSLLVERFAKSGVITLILLQVLYVIIFIYYAIMPWFKYNSKQIDVFKLTLFILMIIFFVLTCIVSKLTGKKSSYEDIRIAMMKCKVEN